jgi:hypothetical protein
MDNWIVIFDLHVIFSSRPYIFVRFFTFFEIAFFYLSLILIVLLLFPEGVGLWFFLNLCLIEENIKFSL